MREHSFCLNQNADQRRLDATLNLPLFVFLRFDIHAVLKQSQRVLR